ncbi:MAG: hypothetical protein KDI63_00915 [Gammaproteobacteria bacterium]|nr:hypothetical protein [Gammaproteobacteria bacterium]
MLQTIDHFLKRADLRLLIFAVLCLNYLSWVPGENEEEYFAFAKHFMNPDWIPHALSVTDLPGTRIIFEVVVGFGLRYLSFEQMAVVGRCIGAALLCLPLALIFRRLRLSHLQALLFVQICSLFPHQSFFGKEWIFGSFETKTIAYALVLYSFYLMLECRYRQSAIVAGLAVWFHVLVGGWYSVVLFIYLLLLRTPWRQLLGHGLWVAAICLPFLAYLGQSYLRDNPGVIGGIPISWVYVYFRNAHHLAPFGPEGEISDSFLRGVIITGLIFLICWYLAATRKHDDQGRLALFFIAAFIQQALFLILAYFDTQGEILKYYPFRSSALSFFTSLLIAFVAANHLGEKVLPPSQRHIRRVTAALGLIAVLGLGFNLYKNARDSYTLLYPPPQEADRQALYRWIGEHTPRDAKFLNMNDRKRDDLDFMRRTERDRFSVFKFVPTSNRRIYDWYLRAKEKQRVLDDPGYLAELRKHYRIDYLVSQQPITGAGVTQVYANNHYRLYRF